MILYDTPYEQVARIMLEEYEKVQYHLSRTDKQIFKEIHKNKGICKPSVMTFTIPSSNNKYSIYTKVLDYDNVIRIVLLTANGERGKKKVYQINKNQRRMLDPTKEFSDWVLDVYTGHFLSRYSERSGNKNLSGEELITTFIMKNMDQKITGSFPASYINPAIKDENEFACPCNEGIVFRRLTQVSINGLNIQINENKTFVGEDNLYKQQELVKRFTNYVTKSKLLKSMKENRISPDIFMKIIQEEDYPPKLNIEKI